MFGGTRYTPKGDQISAGVLKEDYVLTVGEKATLKDYWLWYYQNRITFISEATRTYNCHGYAWHVSEGQDNVWINTPNDCPYEPKTNLKYYKLNPNMTGSTSVLCYNVQRTFNTNITHMTGATLTWTPSGYITYYSGAGTPEYTVKGSGDGNSYVNFQITTPTGFS